MIDIRGWASQTFLNWVWWNMVYGVLIFCLTLCNKLSPRLLSAFIWEIRVTRALAMNREDIIKEPLTYLFKVSSTVPDCNMQQILCLDERDILCYKVVLLSIDRPFGALLFIMFQIWTVYLGRCPIQIVHGKAKTNAVFAVTYIFVIFWDIDLGFLCFVLSTDFLRCDICWLF